MRTLLLVVLLSFSPLCAEDKASADDLKPTDPGTGRAIWLVSVGSLTAANIMDAQSSWNKHELNGNLADNAGRFGVRGALIKAGVQGAVVAVEYLLLRRHPSKRLYRTTALFNFGAAAAEGAVAARNYTVSGH
jgi:hypothetical protein